MAGFQHIPGTDQIKHGTSVCSQLEESDAQPELGQNELKDFLMTVAAV